MLVVYANLQYELVALTGNIHTDEDVTLDRSELSEDERRQAESVARRMRGLRSVIAASHPELLQAYSLTQDSEG